MDVCGSTVANIPMTRLSESCRLWISDIWERAKRSITRGVQEVEISIKARLAGGREWNKLIR